MAVKTQVVTTTVNKPAKKQAPKVEAVKAVEAKAKPTPAKKQATKQVAAAVRHLTVDMVALLSPQQAAFFARGIQYHVAAGRVSVAGTGSVIPTAEGRKYFIARSGEGLIAQAQEGLNTGKKMARGLEFDPAPAGFRFKFVPKARDLKSGGKDSQAVFGAMLI